MEYNCVYNILQFEYIAIDRSLRNYNTISFLYKIEFSHTDENSSPESFFRLSSLRSQAPCSRIRSQSTLNVIREIHFSID